MSSDALRTVQLENQKLREENRMLKEKLSYLQHAIRALNRLDSLTPDSGVLSLINSILSYALQAVDSENGSLILLDGETDELVFVEVAGENRELLRGLRIPSSTGVVGQVIASREPALIRDVRTEPAWTPLIDDAIGFHTRSLICVPVNFENRTLGAIEVVNTRSGEPFTEQAADILVLVARLAAIALAQAEESE